jgi:hypothetical protein
MCYYTCGASPGKEQKLASRRHVGNHHGEYPESGYMAVGSFLFLKEQIKDIIIIMQL